MSTDDSPEKLHEDGTVETPEWHRARADGSRRNSAAANRSGLL
jgi:hypothetical protein